MRLYLAGQRHHRRSTSPSLQALLNLHPRYVGNWGAKLTSGGHCQSVAEDPKATWLLHRSAPTERYQFPTCH